jgi:NTE family protein
MLIDIQMNRYGTFDFDKSEKLIAIGRQKTAQAILAMNQKRTVEYAK